MKYVRSSMEFLVIDDEDDVVTASSSLIEGDGSGDSGDLGDLEI